MEDGQENGGGRPSKSRPTISRRSCDQCRARKIGCDRSTPCSNCVTARVDCTHSAIATTNPKNSKQRVLISTQYEQKIDEIASNIGGIKALLKNLNRAPETIPGDADIPESVASNESSKLFARGKPISIPSGNAQWDHSAQVIDLVKTVLDARDQITAGSEATEVLSSLSSLAQVLDDPATFQISSLVPVQPSGHNDDISMPPVEDALMALRWANAHVSFKRIEWISNVLPLQSFTEVCQKVYFAVDEYAEIDLVLANAYLSYVFMELVITSGNEGHWKYCQLCRNNFQNGLSQLPLLLPESMEAIAALTLGTYNAVENSNMRIAWRYISSAADICQTLGYHRLRPRNNMNKQSQAAQERLFWVVYAIEKGLSLRIGRSSNIKDSDITLPTNPHEPSFLKLGRINGMIYDSLYSPAAFAQPFLERRNVAVILSRAMKELIQQENARIAAMDAENDQTDRDPFGCLYLRCDLVCQYSMLALILRAIPSVQEFEVGSDILDDCASVARLALDTHELCMNEIRGCKNDPSMLAKYINWAILYCPFVPFGILFTRALQLLDIRDLNYLERFTASLQHDGRLNDAITHPYRLYGVLCRAIRLYFQSKGCTGLSEQNSHSDTDDWQTVRNLTPSATSSASTSAWDFNINDPQYYDWTLDSQHFLDLLGKDVMF